MPELNDDDYSNDDDDEYDDGDDEVDKDDDDDDDKVSTEGRSGGRTCDKGRSCCGHGRHGSGG